ncbi:MAG TPA: prolyl oligopeptidase family serine peptidase [Gemmatimonadales bacterium]|nr:prolyl oligopeptidase family serine peptidase [Gemmatimonadales bacterium]
MRLFRPRRTVLVIAGFVPLSLAAQDGYRQPPPAIARILDAPLTPVVSVSPDRARLVLLERPSMPSIEEVAAPELRLAGIRLNPRTSAPSRLPTYTGLSVLPVTGGTEQRIAVRQGLKISHVAWSPDSRWIAFTSPEGPGVSLWVADPAGGQARRILEPVLNAGTGSPCSWLASSAALVCIATPSGRGEPPAAATTPDGPIVQEAEGRADPARTYQDLLRNPRDEALFDHYFTSRILLVPLAGEPTEIGRPAVYLGVEPSPDGRYLLVETVHRPYSYLVTVGRFPLRTEIWDIQGRTVRLVHERGILQSVTTAPDEAAPGPRGVSWRTDAPATLVWTEAQDGGNPTVPAPVRDRMLTLDAPFTAAPARLADLELRSRGVTWVRRDLALVSEGWSKTRRSRMWAVNPSAPDAAPRLLFDRSTEDRYGDPGRFLSRPGPSGYAQLETSRDGRFAFLAGQGASPEGDRPFLDRIELATGKTQRLWRSEAPHYEEVVALIDPDAGRVITRRESVTEPPNYFLRDLRRNRSTRLTSFADPAPEFAGITKQLITYSRKDGVRLSATLYLPAGYDRSKGPLPFLLWAYPREFRTVEAASQVSGSPFRFTRPGGSSHLFLLLAGYGILDDPTMPIVGPGGREPNDTYVEQLVASAEAAVDTLVAMGVAERGRIGVGGHSYGAFMTANLLAHSDLFRAGIARSGAYNRTLTPFGFQAEDRTYWQAPDVYEKMSPFTYADRIKEPILLIHGEADDNSGTFPIQSERMYAALKGNGGRARYVVLPAEAHGYRARESVGHTLYEMVTWMDRYVKGNGAALTP